MIVNIDGDESVWKYYSSDPGCTTVTLPPVRHIEITATSVPLDIEPIGVALEVGQRVVADRGDDGWRWTVAAIAVDDKDGSL